MKKNKHNVKFTKKQQQELQRLVRRVNYQRTKYDNLVKSYEQESLINSKKAVYNIYGKPSQALNKFKNKKEYHAYIKKLKSQLKPTYFNDMVVQQKANYIKAVYRTLNDKKLSQEIHKKIKEMSNEQFIQFLAKNPDITLTFIYHDKMQEKEKYILEQLNE